MQTEIIPREAEHELKNKSMGITLLADSLNITNEIENNDATHILKYVKEMRLEIENTFKPAVSSAKKAYDEARGLRDTFLKPVEQAEETIRLKIGIFVQAENKRRAEIAAKEAAEYEKQLAKAEKKAERTGIPVILPSAPMPTVTKVAAMSGTSFSTRWNAQVIDIKALCKAIGEGKAPIDCVMPNMPVLNKLASISKEKLNIAGVKPIANTATIIR